MFSLVVRLPVLNVCITKCGSLAEQETIRLQSPHPRPISNPDIVQHPEWRNQSSNDGPDPKEAVLPVHVGIHNLCDVIRKVLNQHIRSLFVEVDNEAIKGLHHPKNQGYQCDTQGALNQQVIPQPANLKEEHVSCQGNGNHDVDEVGKKEGKFRDLRINRSDDQRGQYESKNPPDEFVAYLSNPGRSSHDSFLLRGEATAKVGAGTSAVLAESAGAKNG